VLVAIGRIVPITRVDRLTRAFVAVHARRATTLVCIIGAGLDRRAAERQVVDAGLADSVRFVGWRSDTADWYAAADFVALTSDNEGTPLALIEGAAAGRAAVATAVGGVPDVVQEGVTGLLAPVDDEGALAAAMIRLNEDAGLRDRLGSAAPHAADGYGKDRLVDDLERIYRELLGLGGTRRMEMAGSARDAPPIPTRDIPREPESLGEIDRDADRQGREPE
jgi:glycosyltransferase involved in cell wall biosynthesis